MKHSPEWFASRFELRWPGIVAALRDGALSSAEIGRRFGLTRQRIHTMRFDVNPDRATSPSAEPKVAYVLRVAAHRLGKEPDAVIADDIGVDRRVVGIARRIFAGRKRYREPVEVGPDEYEARRSGHTWAKIASDMGPHVPGAPHACARAKSWARRNGLPWPPASAEGQS